VKQSPYGRTKTFIALSIVLVLAAAFFAWKIRGTSGTYTVISQSNVAICTDDIGRSSCGDTTAIISDSSGHQQTYSIKGWAENSSDRKKSEEISAALEDAKKNNKKVKVTLGGKYITSAKIVP
jgi:hypothetical protein